MCRKYLAILFCCLFCFTGTVWAEEELSSDEEQALIVSGFIEDMVDPEISVEAENEEFEQFDDVLGGLEELQSSIVTEYGSETDISDPEIPVNSLDRKDEGEEEEILPCVGINNATRERTWSVLKAGIMERGFQNTDGTWEVASRRIRLVYKPASNSFIFWYNDPETTIDSDLRNSSWKQSTSMEMLYGLQGTVNVKYNGTHVFDSVNLNTAVWTTYRHYYIATATIQNPASFNAYRLPFTMVSCPGDLVTAESLSKKFESIFGAWDELIGELFHVRMKSLGFDAYTTWGCKHRYKTTAVKKASFDEPGRRMEYCEKCNTVKGYSEIPRLDKIVLSETIYDYDGREHKPAVSVLDVTGEAVSKNFYTVTYPDSPIEGGIYTLRVEMMKSFTGTREATYTIRPSEPPATVITKLMDQGSGNLAVYWRSKPGVDGYQFRWADNPEYQGKKTASAQNCNNQTRSGLQVGATYYVSVRTYILKNGERVYSKWSGTKSLTLTRKLKSTPVTSLKDNGSGSLVIQWRSASWAQGIQVSVADNPEFRGQKTFSREYPANRTTRKGMWTGRTIYVRIRTYATADNGERYYSVWSGTKTITLQ